MQNSIEDIFSGSPVTLILSAYGSSVWYDGFGYFGALTHIERSSGYWVISEEVDTLNIQNATPSILNMDYSFHEGSNLISFPHEGALSLLEIDIPDGISTIFGKNRSAMYYDNLWIGSLKYLQGTKAYVFRASGESIFSYPDDNLLYTADSLFGCTDETASNFNPSAIDNEACEYTPPTEFSFDQSTIQASYIFGSVEIDGVQVDSDSWVGAFNGSTCVGARKWDTSL